MKIFHIRSFSLIIFILANHLIGTVVLGSDSGKHSEFTSAKIIRPAEPSSQNEALINELRTARELGDLDQMEEILDTLYLGDEVTLEAAPEISPETYSKSYFQTSGNISQPEWGGDIIVAPPYKYDQRGPDMVSTHSGNYFVVYEEQDYWEVLESTDGGSTWYPLPHERGGIILCMGKNPAIAVSGYQEDYLYVVFERDEGIYFGKYDFDTFAWSLRLFPNFPYLPGRCYHPRIVTDNNSIYVTYLSDAHGLILAYSINQGTTWNLEYLDPFSTTGCPPDIAYGGDTLYVTYGGWKKGSHGLNVITYSPGVILSKKCLYKVPRDWVRFLEPRIATDKNGSKVVIVYNERFKNLSAEVCYFYSTDSGDTWNENPEHLAGTYDCGAAMPDITADPYGVFHVAYWTAADIAYTHTYKDLEQWSSPVIMNDYRNPPCWDFHPPSVAVDWEDGETGVAWSDCRKPPRKILFDRAD